MRRERALEVLALAGLAWVGDLVGYWLAYVLAAPNVTARDAVEWRRHVGAGHGALRTRSQRRRRPALFGWGSS